MGIVGNYSGGSCLQGGGNEIVSIEIFTLEGKKHIARGDLPRVGRYPKTVFNQDPVDLFDLIVHRFPLFVFAIFLKESAYEKRGGSSAAFFDPLTRITCPSSVARELRTF